MVTNLRGFVKRFPIRSRKRQEKPTNPGEDSPE
jgi:hypothetical protein